MRFTEVAGNTAIKESLLLQVNKDRISHAQLFSGHEGCGNLAMAMAFAQYICCENKLENDSCGECSSCVKYEKLAHPDFHLIFPVNNKAGDSGKQISENFIHEWRQAVLNNPYLNLYDWLKVIGIENKQGNINSEEGIQILKKLSYVSYESKYKIILIWMPECMNITAANKLLKILEEPPERTIFLLVSESREQLLVTIQSRTQAIRFTQLEDKEIEHYLIENGIENNTAKQVAVLSDGNLNLALKLSTDAESFNKDTSFYLDWMRMCFKISPFKILTWVENMQSIGRENQKNFIVLALQLTRQVFLLNKELNPLIKLSEQDKVALQNFSKFIHSNNCVLIMNCFDDAYKSLERNASTKILFLNLCMKINDLLNITNPAVMA